MSQQESVLVTDFDGTITAEDFYKLAVTHLLTPQDLAPWDEFLAGKISHFTAIQRIFAKIRAPREKVLALLPRMEPDPLLVESARKLEAAGWHIIVASAGCEWYVRHILDGLGLDFEVHANPGEYPENGPLLMRAPVDSPFYSPEDGVDKAGIVRHHLARGARVAYAGDGFPDVPASLLVPGGLRFAREHSGLAATLEDKKTEFRPFTRWSDVANELAAMGAAL